jgi:polyhydroxyalkanoate synthesis regulator phasin
LSRQRAKPDPLQEIVGLSRCRRAGHSPSFAPMIDVIKKTILAGVGAALTTTEKAEAALQEMVRQGKLSAADARIIAEKIAEQGRREFEEMSQDLGAKVRAMLDRSDAETKARLTALEERVRMLEMNATPPPSRSSEP